MAKISEKPSPTVVTQVTNLIRTCEAAAEAALGAALILESLEDQYGIRGDTEKLVNSAKRLRNSARRSHKLGEQAMREHDLVATGGPVIQGGGGSKD